MIIFLAGVHGVGKTFLGKPAAKELGMMYASASSLIRKGLKNNQNWNKNKQTKNISNNQQILINSVSNLVNSNQNSLLLDGHFVLRNEIGDLTNLPTSVFQKLGLASVILFETPSNIIFKRLSDRGTPQSIEQIEELAQAERANAEHVCKNLNIPLLILEIPTQEELLSTLVQIKSS